MNSIDSNFDRLIASGQDHPEHTRDAQIAALLTHARHTSKHLEELGCAVARLDNTVGEISGLLKSQQVELAANTEITSDVRNAINAGKVAGVVIKWLGYIGTAVAAVYAGFYTLTHWGAKP